jgi:hypothetical protein
MTQTLHAPYVSSRQPPAASPSPPAQLRLAPRGLLDLRLYFTVAQEVAQRGPGLCGLLIDLREAAPITDSGLAALIAIDRLGAQCAVSVDVAGAPEALVARLATLCPGTRWWGQRCASAPRAAHSRYASRR